MFREQDWKLQLKDVSVLCVEDDDIALMFLTKLLEEHVHQVYTARDGQEGVYAYSRFNPDVVITDIEMPRMNGLEMASTIRRMDPDAAVVVSTAFDNVEYLKQAIALHLDRFISKPLVPEEVWEALERGLDKINRKKEEEHYHRFTEFMIGGMPFPVLLVNLGQERVEIANPAAREVGYDQGSPLEGEFFPEEIQGYLRGVNIQNLFSVHKPQVENICAWGSYWDLYIKQVGPEVVILTYVDVTWRKELEEMREEVERITRHDMKTPVNNLIAIPDLLLESENLSQEERKMVSYIKESGHTLLHMINLSLDLYKMERGTYELDPRPVELLRVLGQILRDLGPISRGKKLSTAVYVHGHPAGEESTFQVLGEELLCYSMLSNLVKNAMEASPHGEQVSLYLDGLEEMAVITIHNQGTVPEEIRESFFDKLSTLGKKGGTGLGTYSALLIARTQKGDIHMETSEEAGTYVRIFLPAASQG